MAGIDYSQMTAMAQTMISENGVAALWRVSRATGKPHNPTGREFQDVAVKVVFVPIKRIGKESAAMMKSGDQPTANNRVLMAATAGLEPDLRDSLVFNGQPMRAFTIKKLGPVGPAILYDVELVQ